MWWFGLAVAHAAAGVALGEGVVLDVERETVYIAVPGGGVEAVAVRNGKSQWVSTVGDFPLASSGDLVVAWKDSTDANFRVVGLDATRRGGLAVRCADVPIKSGQAGAIDNHLGGSSTLTARVRNGSIDASWAVESHYAGGAYPTDEILARSKSGSSGSGTCASDGTWTSGPGPALNPDNRAVPAELQGKAGLGQRFGSKWLIPYTSSRVALMAWGTPAKAQVFDAVTGQSLATFSAVGLTTWSMVGDVYVSSNGAQVQAYDASGAPLWSRPVRNRQYTGPYPP